MRKSSNPQAALIITANLPWAHRLKCTYSLPHPHSLNKKQKEKEKEMERRRRRVVKEEEE